jgi:hypothetical protein
MVPCFFFGFRDSIYRDYSGLFGSGIKIEEEANKEEETDDPISFEEKQQDQFNRQWSWYHIISLQVDDDPLKIEQMWQMSLKSLLNHLSYKMSKNNIKRK